MPASPTTYSILGAARSGRAVARLLRAEGASVFVSDNRPADLSADAIAELDSIGARHEFGSHSDTVLEADVLVLSPGVPDTIPIVRRAAEKGIEIVSEIEVAARRCRGSIVAITGTNGKTTTTELAGHIFRLDGRRTFVAGNVGLAFSQIVSEVEPDGVVVLEVSSFQLEHIHTFKPAVAVVLNATPDHLDRYESFESYLEAKLRITMNQDVRDVLILNADSEPLHRLRDRSRARRLEFAIDSRPGRGAWLEGDSVMIDTGTSGPAHLIDRDDVRIRGPHNLANAMAAALSASSLGVGNDVIAQALREFPGVPHRLEPVRELDGVRYVNDSKATNVDSLWYALKSFSEPVILIAGGKSKKNSYDAVLPLIRERVKAAVVIGDAAAEMDEAFAGATHVLRAGYSMEEAVRRARSLAEAGDVILLSPACASFDMFDNYEHRGEVFKQLVQTLEPRVDEHVEA